MKFCADCQFYSDTGTKKGVGDGKCLRPVTKKDPTVSMITGRPLLNPKTTYDNRAEIERNSSGSDDCGPDAQFYVKK